MCSGFLYSDGEPTASWNIESVIELAQAFKQVYPEKTVWLWSGRYKEAIEKLAHGKELLESIDVLIDGPFIEELKDLSLKWRGSSNQHVIYLNKNKHFELF